jgi:hypothetical protein
MRQYGLCLLLAVLALLPASGMAQSAPAQSDPPKTEVSLGEFARKFRTGPHTKKVYNNSNLPRDGERKPVDRLKKLGINAPVVTAKSPEPVPPAPANNSDVSMVQKVLELPQVVSSTFEQFSTKALGDPQARSKALIDQYKAMQQLLPPAAPPAQ